MDMRLNTEEHICCPFFETEEQTKMHDRSSKNPSSCAHLIWVFSMNQLIEFTKPV